jgi:hypothetical protein
VPASTPVLRLDEYVPPEDDIHATVAQALERLLRPPAQFTCFPAGHIELTGRQAAKLARMGLKRNWPDFIIIHGYPIGIELKNTDGELSRSRWVRSKRTGRPRWVEGQREGFAKLRAAGMKIHICRNLEHVLVCLESEGVPMVPWRIAA